MGNMERKISRLKNFLATLLALALGLTPLAARAAQGADIAPYDEMQRQYGDYVRGACALGDALYLSGDHHIFRWTPGDADAAPVEFELPDSVEGEDRAMERAFSDGEGLYLLCSVYDDSEGYALDRLEILPILPPGEPMEVDPGELSVDAGDDRSRLAVIKSLCCVGGVLFAHVTDDALGMRVWALDMGDDEGEFIDFDGRVDAIAACGQYLLIMSDDDDARATNFDLYDPESEELTPACEPVAWAEDAYFGDFGGLACSADGARLYYQADGRVMEVEGFDFADARPVADLTVNSDGDALLLADALYICADRDAVRVRAADGSALSEIRLAVAGGANNTSIQSACAAFSAAHPEVSVALGQDYVEADAVIPAMLSGDDSTDIYVVDVDSELFDALSSRGYMLALTEPAITAAVDAMYPAVRDVIMRDGAVVAVPCGVSGWVTGFGLEAMEALGIEEDELPGSWPELIAWIGELAKTWDEELGVDILDRNLSRSEMYNELLGNVLTAWRARMAARGELDYDDPALAELMQSVLDIDLGALGLPEEFDIDDYEAYGEGERKLLISLGVGCTPGALTSDFVPALLSPVEGEEGSLPISLSVAFANPHTKHPELAQAFLAELAQHMETDLAYSVCPEMNEPVPNAYNADLFAQEEERLASLKAKLTSAAPEDVAAIEADIASQEAYLADLDAQRWDISAEDIAWYRAHAANLSVERYDLLSSSDEQAMRELADMAAQLIEGKLAPVDFLARFDQKARMRAKEGY